MDQELDGQNLFFFGILTKFRLDLGISLAALGEILGVSVSTLYRWETDGQLRRLSARSAEMVSLFCWAAEQALIEYPDFKDRFITFARAAQFRGVSNEYLMKLYREDHPSLYEEVYDFGMLGLFVKR